jgi:hypothetical protein
MHFPTLTPSVVVVTLLAGCAAKMSEVTPVGQDTYTVSYSLGMRRATWVEIKAQALQRATEYCESLGQTMVHPKISSNHATGLIPKEARVTFVCQPRPSAPPGKK